MRLRKRVGKRLGKMVGQRLRKELGKNLGKRVYARILLLGDVGSNSAQGNLPIFQMSMLKRKLQHSLYSYNKLFINDFIAFDEEEHILIVSCSSQCCSLTQLHSHVLTGLAGLRDGTLLAESKVSFKAVAQYSNTKGNKIT